MSTTESDGSHLQQTELTDVKVKDILTQLGDWLRTAKFEREKENFERCLDSGLAEACQPLFVALDFVKKINSNRLGYVVLRIPGPNPMRFHNTTGPVYLIPIRVSSGNPTASGKDLVPGWATYVTEDVEVSPALDCLVVTEL